MEEIENGMSYWYHLRGLARAGNWNGMRAALEDYAHFGLGGHDTLDTAFFHAASAGQADILKTMFGQGFVQGQEDAEEALETLARYHLPAALPSIAYLANERRVSPEKMLNALAAKGDAQGLEQLDGAGVDIFASTSVFFLAFFEARAAAMEFLYEKGAALHHPTNIKGLYARKDEPGEEALAVFAKLAATDAAQAEIALQGLVDAPKTLAGFRAPCRDERNRRTTAMHLQARAGGFAEVARLGRLEEAAGISANDLLAKDAQGQTVLSILAARKELPLVLDPTLWRRNPEEAVRIIDTLRALGAGEAVDAESFRAGLQAPSSARRRNVFAP